MKGIRHETLRTSVRPMRYRWDRAARCCRCSSHDGLPWSGSAKTTATTTIKELAGTLAGSGEDAVRMEAKPCGEPREHHDQFQCRQGFGGSTRGVSEDLDATDDARDLACQAWTSGASNVDLITVGGPEAQALLNQMRTDTDQGKAVVESVTFACELAGVNF